MQHHKPGRRRATLIYDTGAREDDALARFQWVIPSVFLAASLILLLTMTEWLAPQMPGLIFIGLVVVPVGLALVSKSRDVNPRAVGAGLALVACFGLPLVAWNLGLYRGAAVVIVGDLVSLESMLKASQDRSDRVAALACERALIRDHLDVERRMRGILEYRPAVATRCLQKIEDEEPELSMRVARYLNNHWYEGWMSGEIMPEDIGCEAADAFAQTAGMRGSQGVPELLECSLNASSEEISNCCSQALSTHVDDAAILNVDPRGWNQEMKVPLFARLVDAVDLPATTLMGTESVSASLSWTPADLFHMTTYLGCHLMDEQDQVDSIAAMLSRSIETQCGLEVADPLYSFSSVRFIRRTCEEAVSRDRGRKVDVVEWCEAAREAASVTVVEAAKFAVERAVNSHGVDGLERSISWGSHAIRSQNRRRERMEEERLQRIMSDEPDDIVTTMEEDTDRLRELTDRLRGQEFPE